MIGRKGGAQESGVSKKNICTNAKKIRIQRQQFRRDWYKRGAQESRLSGWIQLEVIYTPPTPTLSCRNKRGDAPLS